jgi:uncharacterized protein YndB with AHSA1/START domain
MKRLVTALALALIAGAAAAQGKYPDVRDTSSVDGGGDRVLQQSIELNAPAKAVWDAFTDAATVQRWSAALAVFDLKTGGTMEESYSKGAKVGDPENIRHDIIAVVPGQMLIIRNTNAPSQLPGGVLYRRVVSIVEVQPLGVGKSRLTVSQTGYAPGADFDKLYAFFAEDNAWLMQELKKQLESPTGKLHASAAP